MNDVCRQHGISPATCDKCKSKYSDMQASDIELLKEIQAKLSKLKPMYTDLALENTAIRDVLGKL